MVHGLVFHCVSVHVASFQKTGTITGTHFIDFFFQTSNSFHIFSPIQILLELKIAARGTAASQISGHLVDESGNFPTFLSAFLHLFSPSPSVVSLLIASPPPACT